MTGASSGIGLATARAFAASGAAVVLADIDEAAVSAVATDLAAEGHDVIGVGCDVADVTQVRELIERVVTKYGRLDMAFNNAGIAGPSGKFLAETVEDFDRVTGVNLRGIWTCMQQELPQMQKQGTGMSPLLVGYRLHVHDRQDARLPTLIGRTAGCPPLDV